MNRPDNSESGNGPDSPDTAAGTGGKPVYTVAAVERALDLLDILGKSGPASLAQIAEAAGCTRTAAFRLLRTMAARSYVMQDGPRGLWRLGTRLAALKQAASGQGGVVVIAGPVLARMAAATGRVVYLIQRVGLEGQVSSVQQSDPTLRRYAEPGGMIPLHAGCGRLLLAYAPDTVQAQVLAGRLPRYSPATITDPRRLAGEIPMIRARGWFTSRDELVPGSTAVSAPVRDAQGMADWMVTIASPAMRVNAADRRALIQAVVSAADEIARLVHG